MVILAISYVVTIYRPGTGAAAAEDLFESIPNVVAGSSAYSFEEAVLGRKLNTAEDCAGQCTDKKDKIMLAIQQKLQYFFY